MGKDQLSEAHDVALDDNPYAIQWIGNRPEKIVGTAVIGVLAELDSKPTVNRVDFSYGSNFPERYFVGGVPGLPVEYFPHRDEISIGGEVIRFQRTPELTPAARGEKLAGLVRNALQERMVRSSSRTPAPRRRVAR